MSGIARHHAEWLSLIEVSGPFLTPPVLIRAFPQGLPKVDGNKLGRMRAAYEEWANAQDSKAADAGALHTTWVQLVLGELLEFDQQTLRSGDGLPSNLAVSLPEHRETLQPSLAIVEPIGRAKAGTPRLLVSVWPSDQDLESAVPAARWVATPLERMTQLCRSTGIRLGLVTNGERWALVDAPVGQTAGYASWYAGLWLQEPVTLAAFEALLGVRRFFAVAEADTIEALLDESVAFQQEVTDQLGYQVRRAVEVLVQALDRADLDRNRELLRDVPPARLYDAALTVMMRLVFLFCAEERGLLLLGDETYDANYAVSTLRALLREEADRVGVEVLERRQDAWARLLATFRAVHGGIEHEALRLPALGGSLFDPDRFPFLEGRPASTSWRATPATPLPIDNRTVLHLLEALQLLRTRGDGGRAEARKLSYRALDIEQIGHVYEGLLDHVAVRVDSDTLGLAGTKDKEPELSIDELDRERRHGKDKLIEFLKEHTGRSTSALRTDLDATLDEDAQQRLLVACGNDKALLKRIAPYHALLRADVWGYPQIYRANSFMVTGGPERRQTGTHYTPKSLTEQIVTETLEPLVYGGPAEGMPRDAWKLRSAADLLDLKICDMAMGSGAFLVQVCRWLAERVVEAWEEAERQGAAISADGEVLEKAEGRDLLSPDREERLSFARRLVAERCIYGVDINPMAVELTKLSLWLVTLAKGRPFGFLDHNLRSGDSLLGITSLEQLENFHLDPDRGKNLHHTLFDPRHEIRAAVTKALDLRQRLRAIRITDIEDVRLMARLDDNAKTTLRLPELTADLLVGAAIATAGTRDEEFDERLVELADRMKHTVERGGDTKRLETRARELLDIDCPKSLQPRRPFHWVVEYPEVYERGEAGFDAIIGNPPYLGGRRMRAALGNGMLRAVQRVWPHASLNADYSAFFFLRASQLTKAGGSFGLLATKTIAQGDTARTGLAKLTNEDKCTIRFALPAFPWPGTAAVVAALVILTKGRWSGPVLLNQRPVLAISAVLDDQQGWGDVTRLSENLDKSYQGSVLVGLGFVLTHEEADRFLRMRHANAEVIHPYLSGDDLNTDPEQRASRWAIDFRDASLTECEHRWPELIEHVRRLVKPQRDRTRRDAHRKYWWHHGDKRPALYNRIKNCGSVFVVARVTKYVAIVSVSARQVFHDKVYVFDLPSWASFAVLQSSFHDVWVRRGSSTVGETLNYTPSDYFDTFPFLHIQSMELDAIGEAYHSLRADIMRLRGYGLTAVYNSFHSVDNADEPVSRLRELHRDMDRSVALAYGWNDLDLGHGFHEVPNLPESDRVRFTICQTARSEVLRRLANLNRAHHEGEVREGSHGPGGSSVVDLEFERTRRPRAGHLTVLDPAMSYRQSGLDFEEEPRKAAEPRAEYGSGNGIGRCIVEWLSAHRGWHGKEEILAGTGVTPDQWLSAIKQLVEIGTVIKQGERRGTKYKVKHP